MKIEHIALYVRDLVGARDFFVNYFDADPGEEYRNPVTGFRSYFLSFADGARLEVMTKPGLQETVTNRFGYAHLAFSVGSCEAVDTLTARMRKDGFNVISGPRVTGDGYYESCIQGFEGNIIEITV